MRDSIAKENLFTLEVQILHFVNLSLLGPAQQLLVALYWAVWASALWVLKFEIRHRI